jgi:hypothetical protein
MLRKWTGAPLLVAALGLSACETPTAGSSADVVLTFSPDPAVAVASTGRSYVVQGDDNTPDETRQYDWQTSFSVNLAETEGSDLEILGLTFRIQQATGGIITPPSSGTEYYDYVSQSSGNQLPGNGSTSVHFDAWYDLPNLGREAVATVTFTFLDENDEDDATDDVSFTESIQVRIQ